MPVGYASFPTVGLSAIMPWRRVSRLEHSCYKSRHTCCNAGKCTKTSGMRMLLVIIIMLIMMMTMIVIVNSISHLENKQTKQTL